MKHPALARMLAVFLALTSLLTLLAASLAFRRVGKDQQERLRQEELAAARFSEAEEVFAALAAEQEAYDAILPDYPEKQASEEKNSAEYRMSLAGYTATRAGLSLGREQLDAASAAMKEAIRMYYVGLEAFEKGEAAFLPVYEIFQQLCEGLDEGAASAALLEAQLEAARDADDPALIPPDELLALSAMTRAQYNDLRELLSSMQSSASADQHEFADALRQAAAQYNEIAPDLADFNIERLAYEAGLGMYGQAQAALDAAIAAGADPAQAQQAADAFCEERFGMSFGALGQWLSSNEPASDGAAAEAIDPALLELVLDTLPDDRSLIETAVGLVNGADQDLADKEAAFRADPHAMSAAELLLAAAVESLQNAERLIALLEPQLQAIKQQMDEGRRQLDLALNTIGAGQKTIADGYRQLDEKAAELETEKEKLLSKRRALEQEQRELRSLDETVERYRSLFERARSLRAILHTYAEPLEGEDNAALLQRARLGWEQQRAEDERAELLRRVTGYLLLCAALFGLLSVMGVFEKPRLPLLWPPPLLTLLPALAGEALSLWMGRGLWYSALMLPVFSGSLLLLCPFRTGKKKSE